MDGVKQFLVEAHQRAPSSNADFPPHPPGISLKTQELFLVVFVTRYMDLFFRFYSWYNR